MAWVSGSVEGVQNDSQGKDKQDPVWLPNEKWRWGSFTGGGMGGGKGAEEGDDI